ncbi:MAG TPA: YihY/virulence factor BrkB family protein [Acidobacteriaceae bacterium]|nr:YihY/virulence factor BrkB family protein [Acidobacteriaceae bacterium]
MPAALPSETKNYTEADPPSPIEQGPLPIYGFQWKRDGKVLLSYLLDSEVHTFAFSVAANAILSFIPFIVMLYTIAHGVFHSESMIDVINEMVRYLMPSNQDWIIRNLAYVASRGGGRFLSLIMILISCTGIFLPLEVALNRSWGVLKSRNYLMNQLVALGLAVWMVILGLASIALNQVERWLLTLAFFGHTEFFLYKSINDIALVITTLIAGILLFFAIYWLLPNRRMPPGPVMRVAVVTAILWVASKYLFVAILPHLDLPNLYGPFSVSVGLLLWAYISGLLLFAGAQFSAMRHLSRANAKKNPPQEENPHMVTPAHP